MQKPDASHWVVAETDPAAAGRLATALDLHPAVARVLAGRGLADPTEARRFLDVSLDDLHDPFLLHDMEPAADRVLEAAGRRERVLVYGDYDADGVCATALLRSLLSALGAECRTHIPDRAGEGYGVHPEPLQRAAADGISLVVTVDAGIAALDESRLAGDLGMDLIVTDHHRLPERLPEALAVLHPQHPRGCYPFAHLCGCGVAYKLAQAVAARGDGAVDPRAYLDLAAVATVADVVPLVGENRALVSAGLRRLRESPRPGLAAVCERARVEPSRLDAWHCAFTIGPRLNAAGRVGRAGAALDALLAATPTAAREAALVLEGENRERRALQERILADALERSRGERQPVLLLSDASWHPGVVGIVAARLVEETGRPTLLAAEVDGLAQGSARSVPGFAITDALARCADLLDAYGGHDQAAGFRLPASHLPALQRRLVSVYREAEPDLPPAAGLRCDAELAPEDLGPRLLADLARLAPFGEGNPEPLFLLRGVGVRSARAVGRDGNHLKLQLAGGSEGIGFGLGDRTAAVLAAGRADLAGAVRRNHWRGKTRTELRVAAVRPRAAPAAAAERGDDHPTRRLLAGMFRWLRRETGRRGRLPVEEAVRELAAVTGLTPTGVRSGLSVFADLDLVELSEDGLRLLEASSRRDLYDSPTYRRIASARALRRRAAPGE